MSRGKGFWRWQIRRRWYKLLCWLCRDIIQEELTNALHPDFGWAWEEADYQEHLKAVKFEGWCECLESVWGSLRNYPNAGGDIQIMEEVERLIREAKEAA